MMIQEIDVDLLDKLAERIAAHAGDAIPVEHQLWNMQKVARYFGRNVQVVRKTMACLSSFPKAIRLPSEGMAHPLYNAQEVIEWAKKYRERN